MQTESSNSEVQVFGSYNADTDFLLSLTIKYKSVSVAVNMCYNGGTQTVQPSWGEKLQNELSDTTAKAR